MDKIKDGRRVERLITRYYLRDGNSVGGSLHIVTDDRNHEDKHVRFCEQYALEHGDWTGARIARLILRMSRSQRRRWASPNFGRCPLKPAWMETRG
jgi:hypothetical protein